ncbi:MAG: GNAT family N-acetyltransferase [Vulcanimicrobiaceae bacterium]
MSLSWPEARALALSAEAAEAPLELERHCIEGAVVESTRSYPGYYFGNRFILDQAPDDQNLRMWLARYRECFAWREAAYPALLSWYEPHAEARAIGAHDVDVQVMLIASGGIPVRHLAPEAGSIIAFSSDSNWQQLIDLECAAYLHGDAFTRWRASSFRALMDAGRGTYYGIVNCDGVLLCAAGAYYRDDIARFVGVITREEHRGHGLASALITNVLSRMHERAQAQIIVAERGSKASALYESLGFSPFCYSHSLQIQ